MMKSRVLWSLAVGGALVGGCKDETKPQPPPAAPAIPLPPPPSTVTPPQAGSTTQPSVPETVVPAVPPISTPTPSAAAGGATDAADAQAQPLVDEAKGDIKDKKWDEAQAVLTKLLGMKDKLSPDLQKEIASLQTALDAGKGLKLPSGLPAVPGTDNK